MMGICQIGIKLSTEIPGTLTVSNHVGDAILIPIVRFSFVEENGCRPVGHQTPILHGSHSLSNTISSKRTQMDVRKTRSLTNSCTAKRSAFGNGYSISKISEK